MLAPLPQRDRKSAHEQRGSALLATLCLAGVLSISVAGYLAVSYRALTVSNREMNYSHGIELAEIGLDEVLWALNNGFDGTWETTGGVRSKTLYDPNPDPSVLTPFEFKYDNGARGHVVIKYTIATGRATAVGVVTLPDGTVMKRGLGATAQLAQLFTNAVGAAGSVTFASQGLVDSYDSSVNAYDAAHPLFNAVVSAASVDLGRARVYGFAATNNNPLQMLSAVDNVDPDLALPGGVVTGTLGGTETDASRISGSARQPIFDPAPQPGSDPVTLPAALTTTTTLNLAGVYHLNSINLADNAVLTITVPVVLKVYDSVHISGTGQIVVANGGSLVLQIERAFGQGLDLQGAGIDNQTLLPQNVSIVGSGNSAAASVSTINTDQPLYGSVYLPGDTLSMTGNPHIFGALVAKNITFAGNPSVHFDTALQRAGIAGVDTPYTLYGLTELARGEL